MLFHVASYHAGEGELARSFAALAARMAAADLLLFDFWHTGGVLRDPPARRVRSVEVDGRRLFRIATPREDRARSRIDVHYAFRRDAEDGEIVHEEDHALRHYTADELDDCARAAGLATLGCWGWGSDGPLSESDWYGLACLRRTSGA